MQKRRCALSSPFICAGRPRTSRPKSEGGQHDLADPLNPTVATILRTPSTTRSPAVGLPLARGARRLHTAHDGGNLGNSINPKVREEVDDDAVSALAMLGDLVEVAAQHLDDLVSRPSGWLRSMISPSAGRNRC